MTWMKSSAGAVVLVALALLAMAATSATAAVRTGAVDDPIDAQDQTPSLDPKPMTADITHVEISYDDTGSIDVRVGFAGDSAQPPEVRFELACTDQPKLSGTIVRTRNYQSDVTGYWRDAGSIQLAGYKGDVTSVAGAEETSHTLHASFSHPAFAARGYRCARGQWDWIPTGATEMDEFGLWFSGFEPQRLTHRAATFAALKAVARAYGQRWTSSRGRYAACAPVTAPENPFTTPAYTLPPQQRQQMQDNPFGARADCAFEFAAGGRITAGHVTVRANDSARTIEATRSATTYRRSWHSCRVATGKLHANQPCTTPRALAEQLHAMVMAHYPTRLPSRFKLRPAGSSSALDGVYRYTCHARIRRTGTVMLGALRVADISCTNRRGDALRVLHPAY